MHESPSNDEAIERPLAGRRILVTRPRRQAETMVRRLESMGAIVEVMPVVEIGPPPDLVAVDEAIRRLNEFDWLVFASANGVEALMDRILQMAGDPESSVPGALHKIQIAAVGPATAAALTPYRLRAAAVPASYRSEDLVETLLPLVRGKRVLLARADRGRDILREQIKAVAEVEQIAVYSQTDLERADEAILERVRQGRFDLITVTSSSIGHGLVRLLGKDWLAGRSASISPITSATLRELGCEPAVEAAVHTMDGLIDAITANVHRKPQ